MSSQLAIQSTDFMLQEARRILIAEGQGLFALADTLNTEFTYSIALLEKTIGKVILSGVGKSGHVARKIASTFSSTGTPSFFLHPSEAAHGDLGMIGQKDCLIILSSSGETIELSPLLLYSQRQGIPLIALTAESKSTLAKYATHVLCIPSLSEACPLGLAPTTSTTMMMALGDALALVLLNRKGFARQDYGILHPGGTLGRKLLKISDIMHTGEDLPLVSSHTLMSTAILEMTAKRLGCVGVVSEDKKLIGLVTDGDLRRHMSPSLLEQTVEAVMTSHPLTITSHTLALEALSFMNEKNVSLLCVVDTLKHLKGIIHIHDCLKGT